MAPKNDSKPGRRKKIVQMEDEDDEDYRKRRDKNNQVMKINGVILKYCSQW